MAISGTPIPGRITGDPTRSREAAAAHKASRAAAAAAGRAAEVAARADEPEVVRRPGDPGTGSKEDTVGGRVLMIDSLDWVDVEPGRLGRWLENFAERHPGTATLRAVPHGLQAEATDGTVADCHVPFPRTWPAAAEGVAEPDLVAAAAAHARAERTVGVMLVRLGGYAMGVFAGGELVASKVGGRPVASRQSNGGWSQSRYANRRTNQVESHLGAAADTAARILLPAKLDALILGGESRAVSKVLDDRRLEPLVRLGPEDRVLTVPDPKLDVLKATPALFTAIKIRLLKPEKNPLL